MDYLNVVKYPPSMTFMLLTMGLLLLLLSLLVRVQYRLTPFLRVLAVLGRVSLFLYILHLFLFAIVGRLLFPRGTSLLVMYPCWLLSLSMLYPLALFYGRFKQKQPSRSIFRLL